MDDRGLLGQYADSRSEAAFAALVERHKDWIQGACLRRLRNPHQAEDATQAVFIALSRKAGSLRNHSSLVGWLYQAARFVCASVQKLEARRHRHEMEVAQMTAAARDSVHEAWEGVAAHLEAALDRLPERYRRALLLRFYQQKTLGEVAAALGISEPAAQKRVARGLEKLRSKLEVQNVSAVSLGGLLGVKLLAIPTTLSTGAITTGLTGASISNTLSKGALQMMYFAKLKSLAVTLSFVLIVLGGSAALTLLFTHHENVAMAASEPVATAPGAVLTPDTPEERAAFITPYLQDNTVLVIHMDLGRMDIKVITDDLRTNLDAIPEMSPAELNRIHAALEQVTVRGNEFLTRFKEAGGRHAYLLVPQPVPNSPNSPAILFPMEAGGDASLLTDAIAKVPGIRRAVALNDHVLISCEPGDLGAYQAGHAVRPELEKALLQAGGDIQVAGALSNAARTVMSHQMEKLNLHTLVDSLQYFSASVDLPPAKATKITLECDTEEHAAASAKEWNAFVGDILGRATRFASPGAVDAFKTMKLDTLYLVTAKGTSVTLNVDDSAHAATGLAVILPALGRSQQNPTVRTVNALRLDVTAAVQYASENNGEWPADLRMLVEKGYLQNDKSLTDPVDSKHRAFEYHLWSTGELKVVDPVTTPVIWQVADSEKLPVVVAYVDGHVATVANRAALTKQLDAAGAKVK